MPNTANREVSQLPPCDFRRSTGLLWCFCLEFRSENVVFGWLDGSWNDYAKCSPNCNPAWNQREFQYTTNPVSITPATSDGVWPDSDASIHMQ